MTSSSFQLLPLFPVFHYSFECQIRSFHQVAQHVHSFIQSYVVSQSHSTICWNNTCLSAIFELVNLLYPLTINTDPNFVVPLMSRAIGAKFLWSRIPFLTSTRTSAIEQRSTNSRQRDVTASTLALWGQQQQWRSTVKGNRQWCLSTQAWVNQNGAKSKQKWPHASTETQLH